MYFHFKKANELMYNNAMVFGAQKNSGLYGLKTAVRDEGAVSERMRLDHIKAQRDRIESERAKTSLEEKKRVLERNKREISQRQTEARRIGSELTRMEATIKALENDIKNHDSTVSSLKAKHADILFEIDKLREKMDVDRGRTSKQAMTIQHYLSELHTLELRVQREKEVLHEINHTLDEGTVKMAHLTNDANRMQTELSKSESKKRYHEQEITTRKRNFNTLNDKKNHEVNEVQRLTAENARLEQEIKQLEMKVR